MKVKPPKFNVNVPVRVSFECMLFYHQNNSDQLESTYHFTLSYPQNRAQCRTCHKVFASVTGRVAHERGVHNLFGEIWKCEICGKTFSCGGSLNRHRNTHDAKKATFVCKKCKTPFSRKYDLKVHDKKKHQ